MRTFPAGTLVALALWLVPACAPARADFPARPDGPVLDLANVIPPPAEARLDQELRDYHHKSQRAIVVATVSSLEDQPIEAYATGLFNRWGIGDRKSNQGLLLLVAPNERKVRIEVGSGLEVTIPDAVAAQILDAAILPKFRSGDIVGGISEGVDALITVSECRTRESVATCVSEIAR